jgi:hypothetical protein
VKQADRERAQERLDTWNAFPRVSRSQFGPDVAERICALVAQGLNLNAIARGGAVAASKILERAAAGELIGFKVGGKPHRPPSASTILAWITQGEREHKDGKISSLANFALDVATSKELATEADAEMLRELEDQLREPQYCANPAYLGPGDKQHPPLINNPRYIDPGRAKVIMDSIRWRMARARPDRYGDRMQVDANVRGVVAHVTPADAPGWINQAVHASGVASLPATAPKALKAGRKPQDVVPEGR